MKAICAISGLCRAMFNKLLRHITFFGALLCAPALPAQEGDTPYRMAAPPEIASGVLQDILASFGKSSDVDLVRTVSASGEVAFQLQQASAPPLTWTIQAGPSRAVFDALLGGYIDFGLVTGPLSQQDRGAFKGRDLGDLSSDLNFRALAFDALVPIVNADNPLAEIEDELLARVVLGEVGNWADLGGSSGAISVFLSRQNSMAARILARNGFADSPIGNTVTLLPNDAAVVDAVTSAPGALGLVGQTAVRNTKTLRLNDSCGNPMAHDGFALKSGKYPYMNAINALRRTPVKSASADGFWAYLDDPELATVLHFSGLSSSELETRTLKDMGGRLVSAVTAPQTEVTLARLRSLVTILQGARQLSSVIRLRPGSSALDAANQASLDRARRYLKAQSSDLSEIVVAGFTDNIGTAENNEEKSLAAARLVLEQLQDGSEGAFNRIALSAHGFGEIAPLMCNDHEANRMINRRVEIWAR